MLDGFLSRIITNLTETWVEVTPLNFQLEAKETNPQVAQIVSLSEIVILMVFELKIGDISGFLNLCIPFLSIEPIADKLSLQYRFTSAKRQLEDSSDRLNELIKTVHVPFSVELGEVPITIKELLDLRKGDIVNIGTAINKPLILNIADKRKYFAKPGVVNRKKAIQIQGAYEEK